MKTVPEIAAVANMKVEQIAKISSTNITVAHWLTLARRIREIFVAEPGTAGVVVTHGTNTMEETFRAPKFRFWGYVDGDRIRFYRVSTRRHTTRSEFDVTDLQELPAVEILYSYVQPGIGVGLISDTE